MKQSENAACGFAPPHQHRLEFAQLAHELLQFRQLREAALAEEDPQLRERLWEEYRKYSGM